MPPKGHWPKKQFCAVRPPDAMTCGDELQATTFILHMPLHTLLQLLPLPCPIVQASLPIDGHQVINMGWASSLQCKTQLALQHMARLTQGCHQH